MSNYLKNYNGKILNIIALDKAIKKFKSGVFSDYDIDNFQIVWLLIDSPSFYYIIYINRK